MRFFAADLAVAAVSPAGLSRGIHRRTNLVSSRSKRLLVRQLAKISIFALAAIIFWLFLRYLTTERFPSGDSGGVHYPVTGSLS
jgi:hypothetical protein